MGLGAATVSDEQIKGTLRVGQLVQVKHPEKKEFMDATITKIQDCSQYTVGKCCSIHTNVCLQLKQLNIALATLVEATVHQPQNLTFFCNCFQRNVAKNVNLA